MNPSNKLLLPIVCFCTIVLCFTLFSAICRSQEPDTLYQDEREQDLVIEHGATIITSKSASS